MLRQRTLKSFCRSLVSRGGGWTSVVTVGRTYWGVRKDEICWRVELGVHQEEGGDSWLLAPEFGVLLHLRWGKWSVA